MLSLVITNEAGCDITTSVIVADVFGKNHADVLRDIRNLHCSDEFRKRNFAELFEIKELANNGKRKDLFYEMTKDGFSFLVMGYTGEKAGEFKERFINEFNKRDALLKNDDYIISRAMAVLSDRTKALEQQIQLKEEQIKLQHQEIQQSAPKVEYFNEVLQSDSLIPTNIIAKELGMSAVSLNKLLKQLNVIYRSGDTWVLYHKYQNKGYTGTKTVTFHDSLGNKQTAVHTYWTEVGREFIHRTVKEYYEKTTRSIAS